MSVEFAQVQMLSAMLDCLFESLSKKAPESETEEEAPGDGASVL